MWQQRGWGQHLVLAELEGGGECGRVVSLWWTHSCFPAPPQPASWTSWTEDMSFSTECVTGMHPMGSWVLTLALLLTFEMPVLLGIPFAEGHP